MRGKKLPTVHSSGILSLLGPGFNVRPIDALLLRFCGKSTVLEVSRDLSGGPHDAGNKAQVKRMLGMHPKDCIGASSPGENSYPECHLKTPTLAWKDT